MFCGSANNYVKIGRTFASLSCVYVGAIVLVLIIPASLRGKTQVPQAKSQGRQDTTVARRRPQNSAVLSISRINDPNTRNTLELHDRGDAVIRAAILLDRLK